MKPISVTGISGEDKFFYMGELRMVQYYRRSLSSPWTQDGAVTDFCATTFQLAMENLIMHNVFTCTNGVTETRFLHFFKFTDPANYVSCDKSRLKDKPLGYLEKRLLDVVSGREGFRICVFQTVTLS
jgi:hypothetical protein